jgi:hypothetical protein
MNLEEIRSADDAIKEITVLPAKLETLYSYSVKFVCGVQPECDCACATVRPGI